MPRGDKSKYTDKQERKVDHIAEGYEKRGVSNKEAERRAWPRSIRTTAAAKNREAPAAASQRITPPRTRAAARAARLRLHAPRPTARPPPEKVGKPAARKRDES